MIDGPRIAAVESELTEEVAVLVEMTIESIRVSLMNYQRVVILKEKDSDRYLPIWIGPAEADAIAVRLQDVQVARPLTHDLLRNVITDLGASVEYVFVNDLSNDTFFARIMLAGGRQVDRDRLPPQRCDRPGRARPGADLTPTSPCWRRPACGWTKKAASRR